METTGSRVTSLLKLGLCWPLSMQRQCDNTYQLTAMIESQSEESVSANTQVCGDENNWIGNLSISNRGNSSGYKQPRTSPLNTQHNRIDGHSKHSYVQEINNKTIGMNALRQSYAILKSQNQSLNLVLNDKESLIEELKSNLDGFESQHRQIQKYQASISDSNNILRTIEAEIERLTEQSQQKDELLQQSRTQVDIFITRNKDYEVKINSLMKDLVKISEEKKRIECIQSEGQRRLQQYKDKFLIVSRQVEQVPELEIKLKSVTCINTELNKRVQGLVDANEALKEELSSVSVSQRRCLQLQHDINQLQQAIEDKEGQIDSLRLQIDRMSKELTGLFECKQKNKDYEMLLAQKTKEVRGLKQKNQDINSHACSLERDLAKASEDLAKVSERNHKIDQLFKENRHLVGVSMEKINEIQALQHLINGLGCRVNSLVLQNSILARKQSELDNLVLQLKSEWSDSKTRVEWLQSQAEELQSQIMDLRGQYKEIRRKLEEETVTVEKQARQNSASRQELAQVSDRVVFLEAAGAKLNSEFHLQRNELQSTIRCMQAKLQEGLVKEAEQHQGMEALEKEKLSLNGTIIELVLESDGLREENCRLQKWRGVYMQFLGTLTEVNLSMHQRSQQLMDGQLLNPSGPK